MPSHRAIRIGRTVAVIADAIQLVLFPFFVGGFASVLNDVLDVVVCAVLLRLIGWNVLFLPTFIVEMLPFGDLAPTWTIAVFIATRSRPSDPRATELHSEGGEPPSAGIDAVLTAMPHRSFVDDTGRQWDAWNVTPEKVERRTSKPNVKLPFPDRRKTSEVRVNRRGSFEP